MQSSRGWLFPHHLSYTGCSVHLSVCCSSLGEVDTPRALPRALRPCSVPLIIPNASMCVSVPTECYSGAMEGSFFHKQQVGMLENQPLWVQPSTSDSQELLYRCPNLLPSWLGINLRCAYSNFPPDEAPVAHIRAPFIDYLSSPLSLPDSSSGMSWDYCPNILSANLCSSFCLRVCFWGNPN